MNTKTLVIAGIGVSLGIIALMNIVIWTLQVQQEESNRPIPTITPTPLPDFANRQEITKIPTGAPQVPLAVMDTIIEGGSESASLLPQIQIMFNQPVTRSSFTFSTRPEVGVSITTNGATASAQIDELLEQGVQYEYIVNTPNQLPRVYPFRTESTTPPEDVIRIYKPDQFINTLLPYENESFAMTATYNQDQKRYMFRVEGKIRNREELVEAVNTWFDEIDIPQESREELRINYR